MARDKVTIGLAASALLCVACSQADLRGTHTPASAGPGKRDTLSTQGQDVVDEASVASPRGEGNANAAPGSGAAPAGADTGNETESPSGPAVAFTLMREKISLLPFQVRLQRLSKTLGLPPEHAALQPVAAGRLSLGDHAYAQKVFPNDDWSASAQVRWMELMRALCSHADVRSRFGSGTSGALKVLEAAFERSATAAEKTDFASSDWTGLPADAAFALGCAASLSSLEFLARR